MEKSAAGGRITDFMEKKVSWRRSNTEGFRALMWSPREAEPCKLSFKWSFKTYHLNVKKKSTVFLFSCLSCFCITFAKKKTSHIMLLWFWLGVCGFVHVGNNLQIFFVNYRKDADSRVACYKTLDPLCDHWSRPRIIIINKSI